MTFKFNVSGMTCGHCADRVEKALKQDPENLEVKVDLNQGVVEIDRNSEASLSSLNALLEQVGFYRISKQ